MNFDKTGFNLETGREKVLFNFTIKLGNFLSFNAKKQKITLFVYIYTNKAKKKCIVKISYLDLYAVVANFDLGKHRFTPRTK